MPSKQRLACVHDDMTTMASPEKQKNSNNRILLVSYRDARHVEGYRDHSAFALWWITKEKTNAQVARQRNDSLK
jgi:hypothetical protein